MMAKVHRNSGGGEGGRLDPHSQEEAALSTSTSTAAVSGCAFEKETFFFSFSLEGVVTEKKEEDKNEKKRGVEEEKDTRNANWHK